MICLLLVSFSFFHSKAKDLGSISGKDMFFKANRIDFKNWGIQSEKHLSRVWSRDRDINKNKEEWEIELAKLDIRNFIAHGTYSTVYRGLYDGQDVAGNSIQLSFDLLFNSIVFSQL